MIMIPRIKIQNIPDSDNIADDSGHNPTQSAPEPHKAQEFSLGEDAAKRSHDSIVHTGHKVHPSKVQKMNVTAAVQEKLQKKVDPVEQDGGVGSTWHARYMQAMQDKSNVTAIVQEKLQSKSNLPNQVANTQSNPMNQSSSVDNAYTQADAFPPLENQMSVVHVPSVHMGQPQNPYSPIGQKYAQYNINNSEVLSFDEITSDTSWKARKSFGKGKGRGRGRASNKGKDKNNANWDFNYSVIPKFGSVPGITLFAFEDLMQPNMVYACKSTRPFERGLNPGSLIQQIDIAQIRTRSNARPAIDSSLIQDYYKTYNAVHLVNISIENYLLIVENTKKIVNLHKRAIGSTRGHHPDTHGLLEEIQKTSLGDIGGFYEHAHQLALPKR
jgi:hypothetical protein